MASTRLDPQRRRSLELDDLQPPSAPAVSLAEMTTQQRRMLLMGALGLLATFVWAYAPTLVELFKDRYSEADYSHGYFVIPLAAFFLWLRRDRMPLSVPMSPSYAALGLLGFVLALRLAGVLLYIAPLDAMTIPLWLMGSVWLLCGWRWLLWSLPALAFLFFMAPLPYSIEGQLSYPLQSVATSVSAWMLQMVGQPAATSGNVIVLNANQLNVEEACSGLRMFLGISALAAAYCIVMRRPWWEKLIICLSVLPIAVLSNSLRIAGTGLCYEWFGKESSKAMIHDMAGFFVIFVAAAMMGGLVWFLSKIFVQVESTDLGSMVQAASDLRRKPR